MSTKPGQAHQVILKLNYSGTQKTHCSALKLFFLSQTGIKLHFKLKKQKEGSKSPDIIPEADLDGLMSYFSRVDTLIEPFIFHRDRLLFYLMFQAIPPLKEIRHLDIHDLDLDNMLLKLKDRTVPLAKNTVKAAEGYLHYRAPDYHCFTTALFLNKHRRAANLSNRGIEFIFDAVAQRAGVRRFIPKGVYETCLYLYLVSFQEKENDGINFLLTVTGKRSTERLDNIRKYMITEITDQMHPIYS